MGFPTSCPDLLLNKVFATHVALKQQLSNVHIWKRYIGEHLLIVMLAVEVLAT